MFLFYLYRYFLTGTLLEAAIRFDAISREFGCRHD